MKKRYCSALWRSLFVTSLMALAGVPAPALAQGNPAPVVKATDAPGLLAVLKQAGYDAEFNPRDDDGSPAYIEITTSNGGVSVQFTDCQENVPDFCETLVLSTSWDRTTPMDESAIAQANRAYKYVSIFRDEDGDPIMQWAILTRDNSIAVPLFLNALQRYLGIVNDFGDIAFEGDPSEDDLAAALPTA